MPASSGGYARKHSLGAHQGMQVPKSGVVEPLDCRAAQEVQSSRWRWLDRSVHNDADAILQGSGRPLVG